MFFGGNIIETANKRGYRRNDDRDRFNLCEFNLNSKHHAVRDEKPFTEMDNNEFPLQSRMFSNSFNDLMGV